MSLLPLDIYSIDALLRQETFRLGKELVLGGLLPLKLSTSKRQRSMPRYVSVTTEYLLC